MTEVLGCGRAKEQTTSHVQALYVLRVGTLGTGVPGNLESVGLHQSMPGLASMKRRRDIQSRVLLVANSLY